MDMAAQVWTLIGVIIAGGVAAVAAITSGTRALGAHVDILFADLRREIGGLRSDIGRLDLRIDGLSHDVGSVNITLGELVAKAHEHQHVT